MHKAWEAGFKEKDLAKKIKDKIDAASVDQMPEKGLKKYNDIDDLDMEGLEAMKKELQEIGVYEKEKEKVKETEKEKVSKVSMVQNDIEAKIFRANFQNVNF